MARQALIEKSKKPPKFSTRERKRCVCGRSRGLRKYELCSFCFRSETYDGYNPGFRKISW